MDDFMDNLLRKELSGSEINIPDAGFSARVVQNVHTHRSQKERLALLMGGLLAGCIVALISVPDIFSLIIAQINSVSQSSVATLNNSNSEALFALIKQSVTSQMPIVFALGAALCAPLYLMFLED